MDIFVSLGFCLLVSFSFVLLFRKLGLSSISGMMIAGIITGMAFFREVFLEPNVEIIFDLGYVGLFSTMFIAGMEVSWSKLFKEKKYAGIVSLSSSITPLVFGFVSFMLLGFGFVTSFMVGICMSITAEATKAKVLVEMKKLKTRIGSLMMGVGIIDDMFGLALFIIFGYFFSETLAVKEAMLLSGAALAFFLGVFVHGEIGRTHRKIHFLERILMYVISPFFFVSMGLGFNTVSIILEPILVIFIIGIAFLGKMLGTVITKPFTKLKMKQLYLVGWGMNSRGAVELALAFIALKAGFLPENVYSGLIIMAIVTTMFFPMFFNHVVKKDPKIMV